MKMSMRWYGTGFDTVTLSQIRQVPGVTGVITTLYDALPGKVWSRERIQKMIAEVEAAGLCVHGIESVNVHDSIKAGSADRDRYIDAYIQTIQNLGESGVHLVCYNFMPVFDWTRSDLAKPRPDGSTVLAYDQAKIDQIDPERLLESVQESAGGAILPGWEPERLSRLRELFQLYADVSEEKLFENLVYFLKAILPACEKYDVRMAIHPDDPAWPVFGLPRIVTNGRQLDRLMRAVDSPYNSVTLCTGSLSSNPENDIPAIIRSLKGRIPFAHVRNTRQNGHRSFEEAAHLSSDGSLDMYAIMKALYEIGFDGVIRPDHGRMVWGEKAMPGYGLYDRAMGICYLNGLWEAIDKQAKGE